MSFAVRCRSFDSLSSYSKFAADVQSPLRMMSYYAGLWRRLDFRQRSAFGHVLASFQRPLYVCVWMGLKLLRLYLTGQRVIRGAVSNLRLRRKSAAE